MKPLKGILDRFYNEFDFRERLLEDPIAFPRRYRDPRDVEVSAFISSCFAYGRVELFKPVLEKLHSLMGKHPSAFLRDLDVEKQRQHFTFKYRFNETLDILCLLFLMKTLLRRHGSLENAFMRYHAPEEPDTGSGIAGLAAEILSIDTTPVYGRNLRPSGMTFFFPSPVTGSACKRMNLFLRWMVRDRDIDFGLWGKIPKDKLVIPLDTHIARIARCIGLTRRASADWKTALEITASLKEFDPADPLKYDFALCHHGISGACRARPGRLGPGGLKEADFCRECVFRASPGAAAN